MSGLAAGTFAPQFLRNDGYRTATPTERLILSLLHQSGGLSQADLTQATGLTAQSVMRIVDALLERTLIVEGERKAVGPGRPAKPLHINKDAVYSVGFSLMTDAVSIVLLDFAGDVRWSDRQPLQAVEIAPTIAQMRHMIDAAVSKAAIDRSRLIGAGVGITGYFVDGTARVNPPALLEPWALLPLDQILAAGLDMPVWIDNDGNVAVIGEAMLGAGKHAKTFAYLYFSAGFGGGLVVDGHPFRGEHGNAGEFAAVLPLDWPQPNLERLREAVNGAGAEFQDIHAMLTRFDPQWPGVEAWLDDAERSIGLVLSAISAVLDPGMIVLGGRLPRSLANAIIPRLGFINPPRRGVPRPIPRIVPSQIVQDAAALGAASVPMRAAYLAND